MEKMKKMKEKRGKKKKCEEKREMKQKERKRPKIEREKNEKLKEKKNKKSKNRKVARSKLNSIGTKEKLKKTLNNDDRERQLSDEHKTLAKKMPNRVWATKRPIVF